MQNDVREKQYLFSTADQDIFFTSDLHLGHENIIRFCDRPFANANAMNEALVERWNAVVKDNDVRCRSGLQRLHSGAFPGCQSANRSAKITPHELRRVIRV